MPEPDIEVIHMTSAEWDTALQASLDKLGLTWEQLTQQAETQDFTSLKAQQLWLMAGHRGFSSPPKRPVTDLMRVAQYVKSDKTAPSDVYNAACRMLDMPDEVERLRDEVRTLQGDLEDFNAANRAWYQRTTQAEAVIESVWQYAEELRTTTSPAGIAGVHADRLEELLPARATTETEVPA